MSDSTNPEDFKQEEAIDSPEKPAKRRGTSLLLPVFFIAAGVLLLLSMIDVLPDPDWEALLRLWPLLLILIGFDIIFRLAPHPWGTILSLLLGVAAVVVMAGVLFFTDDIPLVNQLAGERGRGLQREQVSYPVTGVETAEIFLDLGPQSTTLFDLGDSGNLIEADVSYAGELVFETSTDNGQASVVLDTRGTSDWLFWINPANWSGSGERNRWRVGLAKGIPLALDLDLGSGSTQADLQALSLSSLTVDSGSGSSNLTLPGGDYDVFIDSGSGALKVNLPESGRQELALDSGSGSANMRLPASMEAMVIVEDKGSGSVNIDRDRFDLIEGEVNGEGIWVTAGYEDARDRIELVLDTGSGSVVVSSEN